MLALWLAIYGGEFPMDPEKINGRVVQTLFTLNPQMSVRQHWDSPLDKFSQSRNFTFGEYSRATYERKVPRNVSGGLFGRNFCSWLPFGHDFRSQFALITSNVEQMGKGVSFQDFKSRMFKVQLDRMEVKVDGLQTTVNELKATVDNQPTRAELLAVMIFVVMIFGLFFWQSQKRWSADMERSQRRWSADMERLAGPRFTIPAFENPRSLSPASRTRSQYSRNPPHPASAPAAPRQRSAAFNPPYRGTGTS